MAIDTVSLASARPVSVRSRLASLPTWLWILPLVAASAALRVAGALSHATPRYFPDEYIYSSLARSLAQGRLEIRGSPAHFPALLEPLLVAPLWLTDNVQLAYRLTQSFHAAAASLVAIPVYVMAGRLGLPAWQRLACSALALASPALVYSAYLTADAVALPLALAAVAAGVSTLTHPTRRSQACFVSFAVLASFARVQYVVVIGAFAVTAIVLARGRPWTAVRRAPLVALALALPAAVAVAAGPTRALGYYGSVLELSVRPIEMARWAGTDTVLLAYAAGWVLIPLAVVGLLAATLRPASRAEHAFGVFTAALFTFLLVEAVLYATNGSHRFQERYFIALLPLVPILACVGATRLNERRTQVIAGLVGVSMFVLAVRLPLSGYTALDGKQDSPFLQAVSQLEERLGSGSAGLAIALATGVLALVAIGLAAFSRRALAITLTLTLLVLTSLAAGAVGYDVDRSRLARDTFVGSEPRWIDHYELEHVAAVLTAGASRPAASERLFWNRSVEEVLLLPEAVAPDSFGTRRTRIDAGGRLVVAEQPFDADGLLIDETATTIQLAGASLLRRHAGASLWRPGPRTRVAWMADGRYLDGWLDASNELTIWPDGDRPRRGSLHLRFTLPAEAPAQTLKLEFGGGARTLTLHPGETQSVSLLVDATRRWRLEVVPSRPFVVAGGRFVGAMMDIPRFVEDRGNEA